MPFPEVKHMFTPPSKFNTNVTDELDACILKMIQVDPDNRQNSVWDLITDLDMMR